MKRSMFRRKKGRKSYSRPVKEKLMLIEGDKLNTNKKYHALTKGDKHHTGIHKENPRDVYREVSIMQKMKLSCHSFQLLRGHCHNTLSCFVCHPFRMTRT